MRNAAKNSIKAESMSGIITERDIRQAITAIRVEWYNFLCFEHPDPRARARYQAVVLKLASLMEGKTMPTEKEIMATPAGRSISASGSPR
jgi:hypothetical protein